MKSWPKLFHLRKKNWSKYRFYSVKKCLILIQFLLFSDEENDDDDDDEENDESMDTSEQPAPKPRNPDDEFNFADYDDEGKENV